MLSVGTLTVEEAWDSNKERFDFDQQLLATRKTRKVEKGRVREINRDQGSEHPLAAQSPNPRPPTSLPSGQAITDTHSLKSNLDIFLFFLLILIHRLSNPVNSPRHRASLWL